MKQSDEPMLTFNTVEDPNDDFQDLRDKCDLRYLLEQKAFGGLTLPVAPQISRELAVKFKLSKVRQEAAIISSHLLF